MGFKSKLKKYFQHPPDLSEAGIEGEYSPLKPECGICLEEAVVEVEGDCYLCLKCLCNKFSYYKTRAETVEEHAEVLRIELDLANKMLDFYAGEMVDTLNGTRKRRRIN